MMHSLVARADSLPADPAQLPQRQAAFAWSEPAGDASVLTATFRFADVLDAPSRSRLANGLPHVLAMRAYVWRQGDSEPVGLAARTCRVTFDLWDEVYRIHVSGVGGERNAAVLTVDGVARLCLEAKQFAVADRKMLVGNKPYFLGVIVELNPVDAQIVESMKKWVARPAGSTGIGPADALFGSFVGLFVKASNRAERTLMFRTQLVAP